MTASAGILDHEYTVESYIAFLTDFDEASLFDEMDRRDRRRFLALLHERLMGLDPAQLHFRVKIVYEGGTRST